MVNSLTKPFQEPIAIIAGNGGLPLEMARSLSSRKIDFTIVGVRGEAEPEIENYSHDWCEWEKIGGMFKILNARQCNSVVLAGGVVGRPQLKISKLDWGAVMTLPGLLGALLGGDNTILSGVISVFEKRGYQVLNVADLMPHLLVQPGSNTVAKVKTADLTRIGEGAKVISALGEFDIGQGCVVVGKRAVAIEGAEGTDSMLRRIYEMRLANRLPDKKGGVLIKATKPGQDERADLPAIGPQTVQSVFDAKLSGIGVQAMKTLILEKEETLELARELKIFIHGFDPAMVDPPAVSDG